MCITQERMRENQTDVRTAHVPRVLLRMYGQQPGVEDSENHVLMLLGLESFFSTATDAIILCCSPTEERIRGEGENFLLVLQIPRNNNSSHSLLCLFRTTPRFISSSTSDRRRNPIDEKEQQEWRTKNKIQHQQNISHEWNQHNQHQTQE